MDNLKKGVGMTGDYKYISSSEESPLWVIAVVVLIPIAILILKHHMAIGQALCDLCFGR